MPPIKPIKFQIKQYEKLMSGQLNPPKFKNDDLSRKEIVNLLESLEILRKFEQISCKELDNISFHDSPRNLV